MDVRVRALEGPLQRTSQAVVQEMAREAEDRSWIARMILWVFVASLAIMLVILLAAGWQTSNWDKITAQATDLIKTAVLPVVTLVLGFYFGSRAGKG